MRIDTLPARPPAARTPRPHGPARVSPRYRPTTDFSKLAEPWPAVVGPVGSQGAAPLQHHRCCSSLHLPPDAPPPPPPPPPRRPRRPHSVRRRANQPARSRHSSSPLHACLGTARHVTTRHHSLPLSPSLRYDPTIENTFQKTIRFKKVQFFTEIVDSAGMDEYSRLSRNASVRPPAKAKPSRPGPALPCSHAGHQATRPR